MDNSPRTTEAAPAASSPAPVALRWYMDPVSGRHCLAASASEAARNLVEAQPLTDALAHLPGHQLVTGAARLLALGSPADPSTDDDGTTAWAVDLTLRQPRTGRGKRGAQPSTSGVVVQLVRAAGGAL